MSLLKNLAVFINYVIIIMTWLVSFVKGIILIIYEESVRK